MNKPTALALAALAGLTATSTAATTFTDATGDVAVPGNPFPHIDITSVDVSNTSSTLTFQIFVNGNPVSTDWGKYMVGISTASGGDTASNCWGRPISLQDGMEHWIGSWVDGGNGAELWDYSGSWSQDSATTGANPANLSISKNSNSVTLTLDFASLGLSLSDSFTFDVYSSGGGGGDGAVDSLALGTSSITNWGDSYKTSSSNALSYTLIPEPSTALLGAIGTLALLRRRK